MGEEIEIKGPIRIEPKGQSKGLRLHLGSGTKKLDGWVNIDSVAACRPDVVYDLTEPLPYDDQTVDEVLAEDLLEHFDKYLRYVVFYEWVRVLKVGGKITLQVPNFKKILFKYFKFGYDNFVDFIFGENLWESKIYIGHFGNHKWGYSSKSLQDFVGQFKIYPMKVQEVGLNLRLEGVKTMHMTQEALDKVRIYSHANRTGKGEDSVSVGYAREAIALFKKNMDNEVKSHK